MPDGQPDGGSRESRMAERTGGGVVWQLPTQGLPVTGRGQEDLGFMLETPEGLGMNDTITITLKR